MAIEYEIQTKHFQNNLFFELATSKVAYIG